MAAYLCSVGWLEVYGMIVSVNVGFLKTPMFTLVGAPDTTGDPLLFPFLFLLFSLLFFFLVFGIGSLLVFCFFWCFLVFYGFCFVSFVFLDFVFFVLLIILPLRLIETYLRVIHYYYLIFLIMFYYNLLFCAFVYILYFVFVTLPRCDILS